VTRGEIWTVGDRTQQARHRVVVLSGEGHNDRPSAAPYCAPIVRQRGSSDLPPFAVPLAETDPVAGVVVVNRLRRIPSSVAVERVGMATGASMSRINEALRDLFEL
jgi:mRNA interferase MazF